MTLRCFIPRLAAACLALALASCIDGREELNLRADGSGTARLDYSLPASAARLYGGDSGIQTLIAELTRSNPALTLDRNQVATESGRTQISIGLSFESATALVETEEHGTSPSKLPAAAVHILGEVRALADGRSVSVTRSVSPAKAIPGAALIPTSQLAGHRLQTIVHLPSPARRSNATRTENHGRTLIWDHTLADAVQAPIRQELEISFPLPIKTILGGSLALTFASFLAARTFYRRTKPLPPKTVSS